MNKSDAGYLIVAGERRLEASALAGIQSVPVLVKQLSAEDILKVALIENIQRRDLDPIEEAQLISDLSSIRLLRKIWPISWQKSGDYREFYDF